MALNLDRLAIETGESVVSVPSPELVSLVSSTAQISTTSSSIPPSTPPAAVQEYQTSFQILESLSDPLAAARLLKVDSIITSIPAGGVVDIKLTNSKFCHRTLLKRKGYYIVPYGGTFHYYKVNEPVLLTPHLYSLSFPVHATVREGFVIINSEIYYVTYKDLSRGIIRTSRKLNVARNGLTFNDFVTGSYKLKRPPIKRASVKYSSNPISSDSVSGDSGSNTSGAPVVPLTQLNGIISNAIIKDVGTSISTELEELEAVNLLSRDQESELFHHLYQKEGEGWESYEAQETSQS